MSSKIFPPASLATLVCLFCFLFARSAVAADHLDAPQVRTDGSLDINDLYVFRSPQNPNNLVMVITVNPFAGVTSPTTFNTRGVYELNIDTSGDAVADISYRFYFSRLFRGAQRFIVVQSNGRPLVSGTTGKITQVRGGGSVTAGLFDDPFFFDAAGFNNNLNFTGTDFFGGANVSAIVLELPRSVFGNDNISVHARTLSRASQFDRVGRPAINAVLIAAGRKDAFNLAQPRQDVQRFTSEVVARLMALGNDATRAASLAGVLLPDVLTINTATATGFLNGRGLADDVIDAELNLLTQGAVTTDMVNSNDKQFLGSFPYLAAPHPPADN